MKDKMKRISRYECELTTKFWICMQENPNDEEILNLKREFQSMFGIGTYSDGDDDNHEDIPKAYDTDDDDQHKDEENEDDENDDDEDKENDDAKDDSSDGDANKDDDDVMNTETGDNVAGHQLNK
ncbi:hypothetical protein L1887_11544 [Cichorium endivia]|nr:hypothetical protein L1887_11544 [Cichorium endivia]